MTTTDDRPKLRRKNREEVKKQDDKPPDKVNTVFDTGLPLYLSKCGFAFTDNKNFLELFLDRIPKLNFQFKLFNFQEKDLLFELGEEVNPKDNGSFLQFPPNFVIDKLFIMHFTSKYGDSLKFIRLKSFLGEATECKIGIIKEDKLIGILLTHKG